MKERDAQLILNEDIDAKLDTVLELVADIPEMKAGIASIDKRLEHMETDMSAVKSLIKEHETRIVTLEKIVL